LKKLFWFGFVIVFAACTLISGCKRATEPTSSPTQLFPASTQLPTLPNTQSPTPIHPQSSVSPTPQELTLTETSTSVGAYPAPQDQTNEQVSTTQEIYPVPQDTPEFSGLTGSPTISAQLDQTLAPSTVTPTTGPTPTERIPGPFGLNVTPSTGKVSIYHSWQEPQVSALMQIIKGFQEYYPDVVFDVTYVPEADLLDRYTQTAYYGAGPDLLFGSSDWRASLARQSLVEDLSPYVSDAFRKTFTPVALGTGQFKDSQVCLPYELRGVVLYRNRKIIAEAPTTFDQLAMLARQATGVGILGAYFEGGSYFSLAHLAGLGGELLDQDGNPLFDRDQYRAALTWMGLLKAMKQAGALELNGDRDLQLFEEGKSGFLVEGSWNRNTLAQAIGSKNLVIDPWPAYQDGRLSGFVHSNCLYLNTNTRELSTLDHQAALNFMGYFLTSPAQDRLADTGLIPAILLAHPTDTLIQQVMLAFQGGTPYAAELDDATRQIYFTALDGAVTAVVNQDQDPLAALQTAFDAIQKRMDEIRNGSQ